MTSVTNLALLRPKELEADELLDPEFPLSSSLFSILKLVFIFSTKNLILTLKVQKRLGFGMFWINLGQREPKWFSLPCNFS